MKIGLIDFKRITIILTTIAFAPIVICSLLAYLATFERSFELMTHFRFQYLLAGILAAIFYGIGKYRLGILVALFCVGLNAIEILPWYLPVDRQIDRNLRVMVSNDEYFKSRNSHIVEMGNYINKLENEAIVMGDLNMSLWSPYYRQLVDGANLKNTRQSFGIQPSWPVNLPLLQIPIDHCLITSKIKVVNNQIGKDIGSDHYPLIADLAIATN